MHNAIYEIYFYNLVSHVNSESHNPYFVWINMPPDDVFNERYSIQSLRLACTTITLTE